MQNTYGGEKSANPFSTATPLKPASNPLDGLMAGLNNSEEQKHKRQIDYSPYMTNTNTGMYGNYEMPCYNPRITNYSAMNPYATGIPQVES